MTWTELLAYSWQELTALIAVLDVLVILIVLPIVLAIKKDATSAVAWCLLVLLVPFGGAILFYVFGYQSVYRPLTRKQRQRRTFDLTNPHPEPAAEPDTDANAGWEGMARLARRLDAQPLTRGNKVTFYTDGVPAFADMLAAIDAARHHVHMESFIFQSDATGREFIAALAAKARQGVEVRLLYDAIGCYSLRRRTIKPLLDAGGACYAFLPVSLLRRRIQVNLRNHRKILVVDGHTAFTGGLNIGDEYKGLVPRFGYWRDTHLRAEGAAAASLQRVFAEDWDFAAGEPLKGGAYYPPPHRHPDGIPIQVVQSGPDLPLKSIREVYFAAILRARKRVWIASPYFVPDAGLLDALCLAGRSGIDVRLLCQFRPDKWIPYLAARYYFTDVLEAGVKVYQYTRGMMHSKVVLVDGAWASVGTANLDNRSLHLNFEVNCLLYDGATVAELETEFRRDLQTAIRLDPRVYVRRPLAGRLAENACRLLSPIL